MISDSIETHLELHDPAVDKLTMDWLSVRRHTRWTVAERELHIRWIGNGRRLPSAVAIECDFSGKALLIAINNLSGIDPKLIGEPFSCLPKALRSHLIERVAVDFFAALPPALAQCADIKAVHWGSVGLPAWENSVGFVVTRDDGAESGGWIASNMLETLEWLHEIVPRFAPESKVLNANFPIPVSVRLGRTVLPMSSVRHLSVGDVVWIEEGGAVSRHGVSLVFVPGSGGRCAWSARVHHRTARLEEPYFGKLAPESMQIANRGDRNIMPTAHTDIDVPVLFELGEMILPLSDIERLQTDQTFELEQDVALATVKLSVFGSVVAEGKLIAIGRKLGIRIVRIANSAEKISA